MNNPLIIIIYRNINYLHMDGKRTFFHWLTKLKSVKDFKELSSREVHVYIDPQNIQYGDMIDFFKMFELYRVKGREQLEQFLPYLPKNDSEAFNKYFFKPLKNRKLKSKKLEKQNNEK